MERWSGKVAVVSGASSGIGMCITESLVKAGMKVVGLARRVELVQELAKKLAKNAPGQLYPVKCDLGKEEEILQAFKFVEGEVGPLHVLVNSAGFLVAERVIDGSTENFRKILDINVIAVSICIREAVKLMSKHKVAGHIINVNSVAGHEAARILVPMSIYPASKYAITGLTQTVRNELNFANLGIKISSISPGPVRTDMIVAAGIPKNLLGQVPILEPKDVADAVVYALGTPPYLQVNEVTITPLDETVQNIAKQ